MPTLRLLGLIVAVSTAAACLAAAAAVVVAFPMGPVVATVAPGRGIHVGDALAVPFLVAAVLLTRFTRVRLHLAPAPRRDDQGD